MRCLYNHSSGPFITITLFVTLLAKNLSQLGITGHRNLDIRFKSDAWKLETQQKEKLFIPTSNSYEVQPWFNYFEDLPEYRFFSSLNFLNQHTTRWSHALSTAVHEKAGCSGTIAMSRSTVTAVSRKKILRTSEKISRNSTRKIEWPINIWCTTKCTLTVWICARQSQGLREGGSIILHKYPLSPSQMSDGGNNELTGFFEPTIICVYIREHSIEWFIDHLEKVCELITAYYRTIHEICLKTHYRLLHSYQLSAV